MKPDYIELQTLASFSHAVGVNLQLKGYADAKRHRQAVAGR